MNIIKSNGTLKTVVRKWTLYELINKHENDVATYERIVRDEMRQIILGKKGFISDYVLKIERRERDMLDKYDLVVVEKIDGATDPFVNPLDLEEHVRVGTHYKVGRRDKKYDPIDVFNPDDEKML